MLGIVYSLFADYYSHDINIYTLILENSIYCFSKIIIESESETDRQGSSIRLFILFNDNERIIRNLLYKFNKNKFKDSHEMTLQALVDSDFETKKQYLVFIANEGNKKAFLSEEHMRKFVHLSKKIGQSIFSVEGLKSDFVSFYKKISEVIRTPYDRRITVLF